jgi:hypothetical protein
MRTWCFAAEGSWWSSATRTGAFLSTDACRCCAGKYSPAGAAACATCDAGKRWMPYDARLPKLVSLCIWEEDARQEYMYAPRGDQEDATRLDSHAALLAY